MSLRAQTTIVIPPDAKTGDCFTASARHDTVALAAEEALRLATADLDGTTVHDFTGGTVLVVSGAHLTKYTTIYAILADRKLERL